MSILLSWKEEKRSAYLYRLVAKHELDLVRKKLFLELAESADKQARLWENKLKKSDQVANKLIYRPELRTRLIGGLLHFFTTKQLRFILSAMKVRGMSIYSGMPSSHDAAAHLEQRHKGISTAGNLRAAVFGVNDGLVSNVSLLLGIVGAHANHSVIILSGVAGLLAGACSMAAGEYISMRSQREFFEYQIDLEREELELYPEEEAAELACIYRARGIPKDEAKQMADQVISNPKIALDTLAREELGLNPNELGSPLSAALASFVSFAIGAFVPLVPFLMSQRAVTIAWSIGLASAALLLIGALLSLFTSRSAIVSGLRMLLIGVMAGGVTFCIGRLLGAFLT